MDQEVLTVTCSHSFMDNLELQLTVREGAVAERQWFNKSLRYYPDAVHEAELFFRLTGVGPRFTCVSPALPYSVADVFALIYSIPFPKDRYGFVRVTECKCHMGYCQEKVNVHVCDELPLDRVGHVMELWAPEEATTDGDVTFYEYPDSVFLYVEKMKKTLYVHRNSSGRATCQDPQELYTFACEDKEYYSFTYAR